MSHKIATSRRRRARGFTLIELLVVISIIGMLAALLLPAIQSAREAGRRNTCMSNMRNVCLAMENFASARNYYPGFGNTFNATATNVRHTSYIVPLLTYLERNDLYIEWTTNPSTTAPSTPSLPVLQCPTNPEAVVTSDRPPMAFVVNGGQADPTPTVPTSATSPLVMASGVCFDLTVDPSSTSSPKATLSTWPRIKVGNDYISSHDGTSTTLLLAENIQADSWVAPSISSASDMNTLKNGTTFLWFATAPTSPTQSYTINGNKTFVGTVTNEYARPSSNHAGGVNVAFCDGHTRFLSETIEYDVYIQLMTPFNQGSVKKDLIKALNEADYE